MTIKMGTHIAICGQSIRHTVDPMECPLVFFNYIRDMASSSIKEIDLFSDNCPGQNRNRFVAFCLWYCMKQFELKRITHTFLEKGHTETENDSVHATIERKTRRIELYTPTQWYAGVRTARVCKDPYKVIELSHDDIINFKNIMSERVVKNLAIDDKGD